MFGRVVRKPRCWWIVAVVAATIWLGGDAAWADLGGASRRVNWLDWNNDPVLLINLALLAWFYGNGFVALRRRGGSKRSIGVKQAIAFYAGMAALVVALVSPLDALGEQLAWAHMVQHMIVMTVAAPLLVMGAPVFVCLWGFSPAGRETIRRLWQWLGAWHFPWRLLWQPLFVWILYAAVLWSWHVPGLYQAALVNPFVHDLQHLTFFAAACLFWRLLLDPMSRYRLASEPGVLFLFATTLHATVLGVFMTIAPSPWYAYYLGRSELWGLTALEDQQLAGLIMWMPACLAYLIAAVALLAVSLQRRADKPAGLRCKRTEAR